MDSIIHFIQQATLLAGQTLAVLGLLALVGAGLVWCCFPRHIALRWPIYAPVVGLVVLTVCGVPLSQLGLPVVRFMPAIVLLGGGLSGVLLVRLWRQTRGRRLLCAFLRCRWLAATGVLVSVVGTSTALITWNGHNEVSDVWGSSDFSAYWIASDYLQHHGGTLADYQAQPEFVASDIVDHLGQHARLGCMVSLACISAVLHPDSTQRIIIPVIVACMTLLLALLQCWIDRERLRAKFLLVGLLLHPFLYFLLYFTYASQATGVVLFIAALLLIDLTTPTRKQFGLAGVFTGAAILHYPPLLIPALLFWLVCLPVALPSRDRLLSPLIGLAAMTVVGNSYLAQTWHELIWAATLPIPPGWEWRGVLGTLEFAGIRSVLGYDMPEDRPAWLRLLDLALMLLFALGIWQAMRQCRLSAQAWALVSATGVLALLGGINYLHHVPHATHAIAKGLSLFALPILILNLIPLTLLLAKRLALYRALLAVLCVAQGAALLRSEPQESLFKQELIQVARRSMARSPAALIVLPDGISRQKMAPVCRDERRLVDATSLRQGTTTLILHSEGGTPTLRAGARIIDREGGTYVISMCAD